MMSDTTFNEDDDVIPEEEFIFLDETKLQLIIEKMVLSGMDYIEATIKFCDDNNREYEDISKLISKNLKDKIKMSAMNSGYFRKESTLPL